MVRTGWVSFSAVWHFSRMASSLMDSLSPERAVLLHAVDRLFHRGQVGQAELGLDHLDVGDRVDLVGHVDHVRVFKATHHVDDGVGLADVRQELVAQALARAGPGHQAGNVHKLHNGRHGALGLTISASCCRRGSGTSTTPVLGSMVQKG
jgi:hypothetical protein